MSGTPGLQKFSQFWPHNNVHACCTKNNRSEVLVCVHPLLWLLKKVALPKGIF